MLLKLVVVVMAVLGMIAVGADANAKARAVKPSTVARAQAASVTPSGRPPTVAKSAKRQAKRPGRSGVRPALKRRVKGPVRSGAARPPKGRSAVYGRARLAPGPVSAPRRAWRRPVVQPRPVLPRRPPAVGARASRTLSFFNLYTRESITVTYRRNGAYVQSALDRLNYFLRDSRNGMHVRVDPALFDILWLVRRRLRSNAAYQVLSAYRSPETNAWLASYTSGVASNSRHMRGQAMDVTLPGRSVAQLRAAGMELGMGGVGYYPRSGFVHLDTGPVRYW